MVSKLLLLNHHILLTLSVDAHFACSVTRRFALSKKTGHKLKINQHGGVFFLWRIWGAAEVLCFFETKLTANTTLIFGNMYAVVWCCLIEKNRRQPSGVKTLKWRPCLTFRLTEGKEKNWCCLYLFLPRDVLLGI